MVELQRFDVYRGLRQFAVPVTGYAVQTFATSSGYKPGSADFADFSAGDTMNCGSDPRNLPVQTCLFESAVDSKRTLALRFRDSCFPETTEFHRIRVGDDADLILHEQKEVDMSHAPALAAATFMLLLPGLSLGWNAGNKAASTRPW